MVSSAREEDRAVLERLRAHARILAEVHRLPLRSLEAEGPRVKRRYGICYEDGSIRIRLRHARTGELLKYSSLVDTLCHELAHLRHFNHGRRFRNLYERILIYARRGGIYRPGVRRPERTDRPEPRQLELFPARPGPAPERWATRHTER